MESTAPPSNLPILGASGESARLLYRPALWALYLCLVVVYLFLRFAWLAGQWPTQEDVQLEIQWSAIATLGLILSSLSLVLAQRAERSSGAVVAQGWLLLTVLLGIGFAFFQANEYRLRWSHGFVPAPIGNSLYDNADLNYLSAVHQRLMQLATAINASKVRQNRLSEQLQNASDEEARRDRSREYARLEAELKRLRADEAQRAERLAVVNRLLISEAQWTSSAVATSEDIAIQRMAIAALAYDIQPHRAFVEQHQQFRQIESARLKESLLAAKEGLADAEKLLKVYSEPIKQLLSDVAEVTKEHQGLQSQLKSHLRLQFAEDENETQEQANDAKRVALESQLAEAQIRLDERNAKFTAAAKLVTEEEESASRHSLELSNIAARQATIAEINSKIGLNRHYQWLQLPVCIPGGNAWAWTYFVLTTLHFSHLAYLLIVVFMKAMLVQAALRGGFSNAGQVVSSWHSMVIIWVILFVLIYLI